MTILKNRSCIFSMLFLCIVSGKFVQAADISAAQPDSSARMAANHLVRLVNANRFDEAINYAPQAMAIAEHQGKWRLYYSSYGCYVTAYRRQARMDSAIAVAQRMLYDATTRGIDVGRAEALYEIARIYVATARDDEAETAIREAIDIAAQLDTVPQRFPEYYQRLSYIMRLQDRYPEALQTLADCERATVAVEKRAGAHQPVLWVNLYGAYADTYAEMGNYDKADEYLSKSIAEGRSNPSTVKSNFSLRAKILLHYKQYARAAAMADSALAVAPYWEYATGYAMWLKAQALAHLGQADSALAFFPRMTAISDSMRNIDFARNLDELRTQYEVDKLSAAREKAQLRLFWVGVAAVLLLIILVGAVLNIRRIRIRNRAMVRQIGEMKGLLDEQARNLLELSAPAPQHDTQGDPCPESRHDLLCAKLRDRLLRERAYLTPDLTAEGLMRELGVGKQPFAEAFKRCFGTTFPKYINMLRLKEAITLLETTDRQMEDIAESTGFGSDRWFRKVFRENYNMAPGEYRRMKKKGGRGRIMNE